MPYTLTISPALSYGTFNDNNEGDVNLPVTDGGSGAGARGGGETAEAAVLGFALFLLEGFGAAFAEVGQVD